MHQMGEDTTAEHTIARKTTVFRYNYQTKFRFESNEKQNKQDVRGWWKHCVRSKTPKAVSLWKLTITKNDIWKRCDVPSSHFSLRCVRVCVLSTDYTIRVASCVTVESVMSAHNCAESHIRYFIFELHEQDRWLYIRNFIDGKCITELREY